MGRELRTCALVALACLAPAGAEGHGWYSGLKDRNGVSCCGGQDCRPTTMCRLPDGREGIMVLDTCRPIPWDKVLDIASPDGGAHVCAVPSRNGGGGWCCASFSGPVLDPEAGRRQSELLISRYHT